jgi:hypothetical protein
VHPRVGIPPIIVNVLDQDCNKNDKVLSEIRTTGLDGLNLYIQRFIWDSLP